MFMSLESAVNTMTEINRLRDRVAELEALVGIYQSAITGTRRETEQQLDRADVVTDTQKFYNYVHKLGTVYGCTRIEELVEKRIDKSPILQGCFKRNRSLDSYPHLQDAIRIDKITIEELSEQAEIDAHRTSSAIKWDLDVRDYIPNFGRAKKDAE